MNIEKSIEQAVANSKVEKQGPNKEELKIIKKALEEDNSPESLLYKIHEMYNENNLEKDTEKENGRTKK